MGLRFDHVALAVWEIRPAVRTWAEILGGSFRQGASDYSGFTFLQFAYDAGSRVELLSPASDRTGFLVKFLEKYGEGVHHLTFVADDLRAEVARIRASGVRVFGEDYSDPMWMVAYISAGLRDNRLLIQLAQSDRSLEEQDRAFTEDFESVLRMAGSIRD